MPDRFHVHTPLAQLQTLLPELIRLHLPVEVAVKAADLDQLNLYPIDQLTEHLHRADRQISLHAPFIDLSPGSPDPLIRQVTQTRFDQTFALAEQLGAHTLVFHPGYDRWRFGNAPALWLENSLGFWRPYLQRAADLGLRITLENIFEETPDTLVALIEGLDHPSVGHCFDIGHWHLFAQTPLEEWFARLGPYLQHVHLHDNAGEADSHLPVGDGQIDFNAFLVQLQRLPQQPTLTLEAHTIERLHRSLHASRQLFDLPPQ